MRRLLWVLVGAIIGVAGTSFLFAPSVSGARADNFTAARASGFVWENGGPIAPEGASEFCSAVYQGTSDEVSILMTLPDGAESDGAPIEEFFTMVESGELVAVETCFDDDPTNDLQGNVLSLTDGQEKMLSEYEPQTYEFEPQVYEPGYTNGCGANWNGKTVEEMRPGWWQGQQDKFQANLEELIATREPGLSLLEGSTREWAPKVNVGPDVTTMTTIPDWMRNLIIPYCDYIPEVVAPQNPGVAPELSSISIFVASETQAMYAWIETYAPGISLEEAAQRWVDGNAAGWVDTPIAPWGICTNDLLAAAGSELPQWISSRLVTGDDYGCN